MPNIAVKFICLTIMLFFARDSFCLNEKINIKSTGQNMLQNSLKPILKKRMSIILNFFRFEPNDRIDYTIIYSNSLNDFSNSIKFNANLLLSENIRLADKKLISLVLKQLNINSNENAILTEVIYDYLKKSEKTDSNCHVYKKIDNKSKIYKKYLNLFQIIDKRFGEKTIAVALKNTAYYGSFTKSVSKISGYNTKNLLENFSKNNIKNNNFTGNRITARKICTVLNKSKSKNRIIEIISHGDRSILNILDKGKNRKNEIKFELVDIVSAEFIDKTDKLRIKGFCGLKKLDFIYNIAKNRIISVKFN